MARSAHIVVNVMRVVAVVVTTRVVAQIKIERKNVDGYFWIGY
jgi:hypothetical protein